MKLWVRLTGALALGLALTAFGVTSAAAQTHIADPVVLGTGSLKIAFNFVGECALTNYNEDAIVVGTIKVFDANGNLRASASDVTIPPNRTAKVSFSGLNERYHCVASGFEEVGYPGNCPPCESESLSGRSRLLIDALFNGSSTAESEGKLIYSPCE